MPYLHERRRAAGRVPAARAAVRAADMRGAGARLLQGVAGGFERTRSLHHHGFVRVLTTLLKDTELGKYVVPDHSR